MLSFQNNKLVFNRNRCSQCGVCISACQNNALIGCLNDDHGIYCISIDYDKCISCGLCTSICPAPILSSQTSSEAQLYNAQGLFLGHAKDEHLRYSSSTGGTGKALINFVLASNDVDAVYTLYYNNIDEDVSGTYITSPESFSKIPNSIYRPILWGANLNKVNKQ